MKPYLSSFLIWASSYVKANFEAITDFVNRTFTISASGVNSWVGGYVCQPRHMRDPDSQTDPNGGECEALHERP